MRYSVLKHLVNMARTLTEAAEYLSSSPEGNIREELFANGNEMIAQMREVLWQQRADHKSGLPGLWIDEIGRLWKEEYGTGEKLLSALERFASGLPGEVSYQVRAVFVAEIGEKWDSMASVYAYMKDDPRFDPVVVMEPVFREVKRGGRVLRDVIYRDYLTPLGIPFYEYNAYSIEQDCPDLAFICQPYESVTLPQFWPENIAKHTRLVYLPYFFLGEVYESHITTMCRMPVYHHAWKVIGANEKHREFYCKYAPNGGKNMIVTGLPKLDGLATLKERGVPLPKGWEKIEGKTVFLVNTWYGLYGELLDFLESLIDFVAERKDVAQIWRPHPMTETVTKLYKPELYPRYLDCCRRMESAPNIVVDHETSFDAAFYYSDAMNSTSPSSMVAQYLLMDKPLFHWPYDKKAVLMELVDSRWMETENGFTDRIRQRIDKNADLRRNILKSDLPLADGRSGERVCNVLWESMHEEDGVQI